jgi:hypothetical protein
VCKANCEALLATLKACLRSLPNGREVFAQGRAFFRQGVVNAQEAVQHILLNLPRDLRRQNRELFELIGDAEKCHELMQWEPEDLANDLG